MKSAHRFAFIVHHASFIVRLERETGLEPATATLATWNSTTELLPLMRSSRHQLVDLRGFEPLTS
jgi:hypothetical protein